MKGKGFWAATGGAVAAIVTGLVVASCSKEPEGTETQTGVGETLVIKVDGMQKGDGGKT